MSGMMRKIAESEIPLLNSLFSYVIRFQRSSGLFWINLSFLLLGVWALVKHSVLPSYFMWSI